MYVILYIYDICIYHIYHMTHIIHIYICIYLYHIYIYIYHLYERYIFIICTYIYISHIYHAYIYNIYIIYSRYHIYHIYIICIYIYILYHMYIYIYISYIYILSYVYIYHKHPQTIPKQKRERGLHENHNQLYSILAFLQVFPARLPGLKTFLAVEERLAADDRHLQHRNHQVDKTPLDLPHEFLQKKSHLDAETKILKSDLTSAAFHKWGYPKNSVSNGTSIYKWMIWRYPHYPHFRNPPADIPGAKLVLAGAVGHPTSAVWQQKSFLAPLHSCTSAR